MTETTHPAVEAQIKLLFTRGLSAQAHANLRAHVATCAACARVYERYAEAERGLHQQDPESALNASMQARIEQHLLETEAPPRKAVLPRVAVALATVSALAFTAFSVITPPTPDAMQPRGAALQDQSSGPILRILRVRQVDGRPEVQALGHMASQLRPGDEVALLYVNLSDARTVQVTLQSQDHEDRVLVPRQTIFTGVEDQRLGPVLRVTADWPEGSATIVGQFEGPKGPVVRKISILRQQP